MTNRIGIRKNWKIDLENYKKTSIFAPKFRTMNHLRTFVSAAAVLLLLAGCSKRQDEWITTDQFVHDSLVISFERINDSLTTIRLKSKGILRDSLLLPYPVYQRDCGDLTGDGLPEIAIGVIKPTRYWPTPDRRLFIYHLFHGRYIRPLWLGSRVGNQLWDFKVCRDSVPARIQTEEILEDSTVVHRQYRIKGFGLSFEKEL